MDFNKNYDETDEELYPRESKTHRTVRYIFRYTLYGISFLIWGIIMYLLFSTKEPGMFDDMIFTSETHAAAKKDPDAFTVYNIQPRTDMNYFGSIQLHNIYYADTVDQIEIGVMFNLDKITGGKTENALVYILKDSKNNYYDMVNLVSDSNSRYGYLRVCFENVSIDLEKNKYYNHIISYDFESEYNALFENDISKDTSEQEERETGITFTLSIYYYDEIISKDYAQLQDGIVKIDYERFSDDDTITNVDSFSIYNNNTVITYENFK
ncbi:MAG: hypothetical protein PHD46_05255 [Eubacteriales bacterium]|nr:hypothetical protein [Eubacteriales bacterium]